MKHPLLQLVILALTLAAGPICCINQHSEELKQEQIRKDSLEEIERIEKALQKADSLYWRIEQYEEQSDSEQIAVDNIAELHWYFCDKCDDGRLVSSPHNESK